MPIVKRNSAKSQENLRVPQLRALQALAEQGALCRGALCEACGFTAVSGSLTRVLNGLREGSSSGAAHAGLLQLGYIEECEIDIDGAKEVVYRITKAGLAALEASTVELPPLRDKKGSTNKRYKHAASEDARE